MDFLVKGSIFPMYVRKPFIVLSDAFLVVSPVHAQIERLVNPGAHAAASGGKTVWVGDQPGAFTTYIHSVSYQSFVWKTLSSTTIPGIAVSF